MAYVGHLSGDQGDQVKASWYKDQGGTWFLEVIYTSYETLDQLKEEHVKKGRRTWLNLWDGLKDEWLLTVEMGERK